MSTAVILNRGRVDFFSTFGPCQGGYVYSFERFRLSMQTIRHFDGSSLIQLNSVEIEVNATEGSRVIPDPYRPKLSWTSPEGVSYLEEASVVAECAARGQLGLSFVFDPSRTAQLIREATTALPRLVISEPGEAQAA